MDHHQEATIEKGYSNGHDYEGTGGPYEEKSVGTIAAGRGGETHRGLKSRHIQFLYDSLLASPLNRN